MEPVGGGDTGGKMKQESSFDCVAQDHWRSAREGQGAGGADGSHRRIRARADRMLNKEHRSMRGEDHWFGAQLKCVQSSPTVVHVNLTCFGPQI